MNLPFMADYANNHHFKNYIPDRDINDKILTKNSVPSNLQEVPVLGDFMKTLLVSQTVITTDHQMRKFQEKHLQLWVRYHEQASLSILYARRLNILKKLLKDPCKAMTLLKEKATIIARR